MRPPLASETLFHGPCLKQPLVATGSGDAGIDTLARRDGRPLHLEKARRGRHRRGTGYVQVRVSFLSAVNAGVTRASCWLLSRHLEASAALSAVPVTSGGLVHR